MDDAAAAVLGQVVVVLPLPELELPLLELPLDGVAVGVADEPELSVVVMGAALEPELSVAGVVVGEAATARVMAKPPAKPPTISPPVTVAMASRRRHR